MEYYSDLHIHSKYSRACSTQLDIPNLEKYAKIKGVNLLGTSDFTHPEWIKHLKEKLTEDDTGILRTESGFPFLLSTELSLIYSQNGKGRKVHNLVFAKDFDTVSQITEELLKRGRVDYDGRPIFGIPCPEFTEMLKQISSDIEIIPAHIWTPWFGMLGSKGGFNSLKECFLDQTKHINAVETGLSSDPPMNWRVPELDDYSLVSFSDSHSFWPWRLGREATIFDLKDLKYDNIIKALKTKEGLSGTIEVDPGYGKYHYDGHRNCNISLSPKQTKELNGICPVCKKPLTIGVEYRIEELAKRPEGFKLDGAPGYKKLIPLSELISLKLNAGIATKKVWAVFNDLMAKFDNENEVILNASEEELNKVVDEKMTDIIMRNRRQEIYVQPGYDGEYGVPVLDKSEIKQVNVPVEYTKVQKGLGDFF